MAAIDVAHKQKTTGRAEVWNRGGFSIQVLKGSIERAA